MVLVWNQWNAETVEAETVNLFKNHLVKTRRPTIGFLRSDQQASRPHWGYVVRRRLSSWTPGSAAGLRQVIRITVPYVYMPKYVELTVIFLFY